MDIVLKYLKILTNFLVAAFTIFIVFYILPKFLVFFLPFVIGWAIAAICNPIVKWLEKKLNIVRKYSSMFIVIVVLALVVICGYFVIDKLVSELVNLVSNATSIYASVLKDYNEMGKNLQVIYDKLPNILQERLTEINKELMDNISLMVKNAGSPTVIAAGEFAKNLPNTLISIIMTIISAYFFIADREKILEVFKAKVPTSIYERINYVTESFSKIVGGYFKAQFKIMGVVGIILLVGLLILDVNYAVLLAFLIAFLDMLPFFGTGTVLVPWAVIKLFSSDYKMALGLFLIYLVSQLVRQLIQPKVLGDSIGLNPLLTLIFMFIGYKLSGVLGMIMAVPVGMILINMFTIGLFDNLIRCGEEIVKDINKFRKWQ